MKLKNIFTLTSMALLSLVSCEMKDELIGKGDGSSDMGLLEIGVAVNSKVNNVTKASDDEVISTSPSADGFILDIINGEGFTKEYTYDDSEETNAIELPVGEYQIYAHTPGKLEVKMDAPYYGGKESLSVKKGLTTKAEVVCKMENTKIQLIYGGDFLTTFATWDITITDGVTNLTYNQEDKEPAAVYWVIEEGVKTIEVNISATTSDGKKVSDKRRLSKPEGSSEYWEGNDALTITMTPGTEEPTDPDQPVDPEEPTDPEEDHGVKGIEIKVDGEFGDLEEEVVDVPVTPGDDSGDGGDEGDGGEDGDGGDETPAEEPSLSGKYLSETLIFQQGSKDPFPEVSIDMNAPAGLSSVKVKVVTDNADFEKAVSEFGLTVEGGAELINNTQLEDLFTLPETGQKEYTFSLGSLGSMLALFDGNHTFEINVTDANGKTASDALKVNIVKAE